MIQDISKLALTKTPICILTSNSTFSAAAALSFILKNRKRAIIVSEKTAGGGNSTGFYSVLDKYVVGVPEGITIDPLTGTEREKVGVQPDTAISSDLAFEKA